MNTNSDLQKFSEILEKMRVWFGGEGACEADFATKEEIRDFVKESWYDLHEVYSRLSELHDKQ